MKFLAAVLLCLPLAGASSESAPGAVELRIAAASDLKFALEGIITSFANANPGSRTKCTYGASGNLFAQIQNGAPFDIFLSADTNYPQRLVEGGLATNLFLYAEGHLALWVPSSSKLDLETLGLSALLDPSVRKIAIANPAHAPYGRAAVDTLQAAHIYDRITNLFVLGENIAQTAQFVQIGGADIAILSLSLAGSAPMRDRGRYVEIPSALQQAGVLICRSKHLGTAKTFCKFLGGSEARAILGRHGLAPK